MIHGSLAGLFRQREGRDMTLAEFVQLRGRSGAAKALGCTPPALSKAIGASREIYVVIQEDRTPQAIEVSRFPGCKP